MSLVQGLTAYYRALGLRGVFAISTYRLTGHPREVSVQPVGIKNPLHIRVRTTDLSVYNEIFLGGQYSFELPRCPRTIVDVGANIGLTSVFYAHKYPDSKIIAIEPEASNFHMLTKNARPYPNIIPIHAALWSRDGEISIREPDPTTGTYGKWGFATYEGEGTRVRAITMRTLMMNMNLGSIGLLKVDIEGAEKEVFENCDWMERIGCLAIELHDRFKPGCSAAVNSAARGFSKFQHGETMYYLHR